MQTDPASLDPEERFGKFFALMSAGLGFFSLCGALIPILGTILGILGIALGMLGRKSENKRIAIIGIGISIIGLLTAIIYSVLIYIAKY